MSEFPEQQLIQYRPQENRCLGRGDVFEPGIYRRFEHFPPKGCQIGSGLNIARGWKSWGLLVRVGACTSQLDDQDLEPQNQKLVWVREPLVHFLDPQEHFRGRSNIFATALPEDSSSTNPRQKETEAAEAFAEEIRQSPRRAVAKAKLMGSLGKERRKHFTRLLFPFLFKGSVGVQRLVFAALKEFASPGDIFRLGMAQFRQFGYEGDLVTTTELLSQFGRASFPFFRTMARSNFPEAVCFVESAAKLPNVSLEDRLFLLKGFAANPDLGTRVRVLESLDSFPKNKVGEVLQVLTQGCEDDEVRQAAIERLEM